MVDVLDVPLNAVLAQIDSMVVDDVAARPFQIGGAFLHLRVLKPEVSRC
ncbi:MAG: hypothetical protein ACO3L6_03560 [Dehalococcoidia bacterium]